MYGIIFYVPLTMVEVKLGTPDQDFAALFFMSRTTIAQNDPHPANVKQFHTLPHNCVFFLFSISKRVSDHDTEARVENLHNCLAALKWQVYERCRFFSPHYLFMDLSHANVHCNQHSLYFLVMQAENCIYAID